MRDTVGVQTVKELCHQGMYKRFGTVFALQPMQSLQVDAHVSISVRYRFSIVALIGYIFLKAETKLGFAILSSTCERECKYTN